MKTIKEQMDNAIKELKAINRRILKAGLKRCPVENPTVFYGTEYMNATDEIEEAIYRIREAKKRFKRAEREKV